MTWLGSSLPCLVHGWSQLRSENDIGPWRTNIIQDKFTLSHSWDDFMAVQSIKPIDRLSILPHYLPLLKHGLPDKTPFHLPISIQKIKPSIHLITPDEQFWIPWNLLGSWRFGTFLFFFIFIVNDHHPNWLSYMFQRGRYTTHQSFSLRPPVMRPCKVPSKSASV